MNIKLSKAYIFITNQSGVTTDILSAFKLKKVPPEIGTYQSSINPNEVFMGIYKNNLVINNAQIANSLFSSMPSNTEKILINLFPESEIASIIENVDSGIFGYFIIDKGRRVRIKYGDLRKVIYDCGPPILEEIEVAEREIFTEFEMEKMRKKMNKSQVSGIINSVTGWRVLNLVSKRYLGDPLTLFDSTNLNLETFTIE